MSWPEKVLWLVVAAAVGVVALSAAAGLYGEYLRRTGRVV